MNMKRHSSHNQHDFALDRSRSTTSNQLRMHLLSSCPSIKGLPSLLWTLDFGIRRSGMILLFLALKIRHLYFAAPRPCLRPACINNVDLLVSGFGQIYLTVKYI
jgi:hypothetical protein